MAETLTERFGLWQWGEGTDTPQRVEFNQSFLNIDQLAAIDMQGDSLPAPGIRGTYYYDTVTGVLWRDSGSAWTAVGSRTRDAVAGASGVDKVALTVAGATGQTANLFEVKLDAITVASINKDGDIAARLFSGARLKLENTSATSPVIQGTGASGQTADLLELKSYGGQNRFKVTKDGNIQSPFFAASAGAGVIGAGTATNVQGADTMSGIPAFEVRSTKGGTGAFNDFIYFKHDAAGSQAVLRRLGFFMKVGNETVGDAAKSGGMYLESDQANFSSPSLVVSLSDEAAMTFRSNMATVHTAMEVAGTITQTSGSQTLVSGDTSIGRQEGHQYFRAGSSHGFYWYKGGSHSDTPGSAGGGTKLAALDANGKFETGKLLITSTTNAALSTPDPPFQIGPTTGQNLIMDTNEIMVRNNGGTANLFINGDGGNVTIGNGSTTDSVDLRGTRVQVNGKAIYIQASAPSSGMFVGDIWIDI